MSDWKVQYEDAADAEYARYLRMPISSLVAEITAGRTGEYHTIWRAVAEGGTAPEVGWKLYDVLTSDRPYLERYHCAGALLRVIGCTEFEPVALSAKWPTLPQNLARLRDLVEQAAGKRAY